MGGSDSVSQETKNEPWGPQAEQLRFLFDEARQQYGETPRYYPGSTVAPQSGASAQSQQSAYERLLGGSPDINAASSYGRDVMGGRYLDPDSNPHLRKYGDYGASDITRHYQTAIAPTLSMAGSGQAGSGREANAYSGSQRNLGDSLGRYYADLYGSAYDRERGRMDTAAGRAPGFAASERADIGMAVGAGQVGDAYGQRRTSADVGRYEYGRDIKRQQLEDFRRMITPPWQAGQTSAAGNAPGEGAAPYAGMATSLIGTMIMASAMAPAAASSRSYKNHIGSVHPVALSRALSRVPVSTWTYKPEAPVIGAHDGAVHIGPMAEDWHDAFGTGDGTSIPYIDYLGTLMAALQGALIRVGQLEKTITALAKASGSEAVAVEPMPEGA